MWYLIFVIFLIFFFKPTNELFMPLDDVYKKNHLKENSKKIPYSEFLIDLNNNLKKELNSVQSKRGDLNIQVRKNSLNQTFNKISSSYPDLIMFKSNEKNDYIKPEINRTSISDEMKYSNDRYISKIDPSLKIQNNKKIIQDIKYQDDLNYYTEKDDNLDVCVYKANQLSEYTNPKLYLSSSNVYFPPRWLIKTYKNTPLPKSTNLKLWTDMYNCCLK